MTDDSLEVWDVAFVHLILEHCPLNARPLSGCCKNLVPDWQESSETGFNYSNISGEQKTPYQECEILLTMPCKKAFPCGGKIIWQIILPLTFTIRLIRQKSTCHLWQVLPLDIDTFFTGFTTRLFYYNNNRLSTTLVRIFWIQISGDCLSIL